jgi:hypothetical protein
MNDLNPRLDELQNDLISVKKALEKNKLYLIITGGILAGGILTGGILAVVIAYVIYPKITWNHRKTTDHADH